MIAQQSGNNCVARAFSTMRLALGYDVAVPKELENDVGPKATFDVLNSINKWFPNHDSFVYCAQNEADMASDKSAYAGPDFEMTEQEVDKHIVAFSYYTTKTGTSHFVIGAPTIYEYMNTDMIVCVKQ